MAGQGNANTGSGEVILLDPMMQQDPIISLTQRSQCVATAKSGQRCRHSAIAGGTVCHLHGGKAPQVQRKARLRLLELVDPAITTLAREMATAQNSTDRQRAANSILDRAGISRIGTPEGEAVRALLVERLMMLKEG